MKTIFNFVCLSIIGLFFLASCGIGDVIDSLDCFTEHNDPALLTAYSQALEAYNNDPDDAEKCRELVVALNNYIDERVAYISCLRDNANSQETIDDLDDEIASLESDRDELDC